MDWCTWPSKILARLSILIEDLYTHLSSLLKLSLQEFRKQQRLNSSKLLTRLPMHSKRGVGQVLLLAKDSFLSTYIIFVNNLLCLPYIYQVATFVASKCRCHRQQHCARARENACRWVVYNLILSQKVNVSLRRCPWRSPARLTGCWDSCWDNVNAYGRENWRSPFMSPLTF